MLTEPPHFSLVFPQPNLTLAICNSQCGKALCWTAYCEQGSLPIAASERCRRCLHLYWVCEDWRQQCGPNGDFKESEQEAPLCVVSCLHGVVVCLEKTDLMKSLNQEVESNGSLPVLTMIEGASMLTGRQNWLQQLPKGTILSQTKFIARRIDSISAQATEEINAMSAKAVFSLRKTRGFFITSDPPVCGLSDL